MMVRACRQLENGTVFCNKSDSFIISPLSCTFIEREKMVYYHAYKKVDLNRQKSFWFCFVFTLIFVDFLANYYVFCWTKKACQLQHTQ